MAKEKCPNQAVSLFPWAGEIIACCNTHTNVFSVLNKAMGGVQEPRPITEICRCEMPNDLDMYKNSESKDVKANN